MRTSVAPASGLAPARSGGRLPAFLLALATAAAAAQPAETPEVPDQTLERIDALLASQAWELALRRTESAQAAASGERWEALERRRFEVYRRLGDPETYAERVERLPPDVSAEFRRRALEGLIETCLAARDPDCARTALVQRVAAGVTDESREWRERLVRLYLDLGRPAEALDAFAPLEETETAHELHAEILLHAGRDRDAFEQVAGLKSLEARLWRLIALWRLDLYAPDDAVVELSRLARELSERPRLLRLVWLARADAAALSGQLIRQVHSLEQAFRLDPAPAAGLVDAAPGRLWSAYLALARHVATRDDLSLGDAALERAGADEDGNGHTARALYAWHALEAEEEEIRRDAHERLAASLLDRKLGPVVRVLYTAGARLAPADIPAGVRHVLVADALDRRDFEAAAKHARRLDSPLPDQSEFEWNLRRARVLLYGGDVDAAIELLERLIAAPELDAELAQRWVQVVFDVQSLGRERETLTLLEAVYARVDNARLRRELLYWRAESAAALGRFGEAAELYLRSARFDTNDGSDPWGHSARFRAAEALADAGLRHDAEAVYRGLLAETSAPNRRLLIEQHIERLWLDRPESTTP